MSLPEPIPRLVPERSFPAYSYVSGRFPHPVSDPRGHSYGLKPDSPAPPDPDRWRACQPYLFGIDLFNHGYYWEAHEAWESLWHACGRRGVTATFLKGLIKLAAAGVKVRAGRPEGVRVHARRAAALFDHVAHAAGGPEARYMGLQLSQLIDFALALAEHTPAADCALARPVEIVFDFVLRPDQARMA